MPKIDYKRLKRDLGIRPTEEEYYFELLRRISFQSESLSRKQAAILVKDNIIIAAAYFKAIESDKVKLPEEKERGLGAIERAIAECARLGVNTDGATLYVYSFPGDIVCEMLIEAGIKKIVYVKCNFTDGIKLCEKKGVQTMIFKLPVV